MPRSPAMEMAKAVAKADAAVLAKLFQITPCQVSLSIRRVALVDSQPRLLSLKQALRVYLEHRFEIVRRRSEHELKQAKDRAHILEGLIKAIDNLDEVVAIIRKSQTVDTAKKNLINFTLKILRPMATASI